MPNPPGRLVGRERELEEIADVLAHRECRLLTLTGPGGSGKTRLAIEVAARRAEYVHDGLGFVALGTVREPDGIVPAIATELGLTLPGNVDPEQHLLDWLRDRSVFLVLDALVGLASVAIDAGDDDADAVETFSAVLAHPATHGQLRSKMSNLIQRYDLPITPPAQPDRWAVKVVDDIVRRLVE